MKEKLIAAHRGFHKNFPENSIAAFNAAISAKADIIELDVRKTKDNMLVVSHNPDFNGKIISRTNSVDLPELARLESVLDLAKGKVVLDIELKESGYEEKAVSLALKHLQPKDFVFTSFKKLSMVKIKRHFPEIKVGWLFSPNFLARIIDWFWLHSPYLKYTDFLAPHYSLEKNFSGKNNLWFWTIDGEENLIKFIAHSGAEVIITNEPDVALQLKIENYDTGHEQK
ncbi:MAG: glycerophosphodiester phosphodiesterase [Candidatus Doudnabacteria bacterium]|nr:glycerophosphodiester phosphodiesterase [Candidatus Doudnabacteria bacterium]